MPFSVKKEPDDFAKHFFGAIERCTFCLKPTKYWHEATNNPVCQECAENHDVSELHDWKTNTNFQK